MLLGMAMGLCAAMVGIAGGATAFGLAVLAMTGWLAWLALAGCCLALGLAGGAVLWVVLVARPSERKRQQAQHKLLEAFLGAIKKRNTTLADGEKISFGGLASLTIDESAEWKRFDPSEGESQNFSQAEALADLQEPATDPGPEVRLYDEIDKHCLARRYAKALAGARRLMEAYPDTEEAEIVRSKLPTLEANACLEEARELRDEIRYLLRNGRYSKATHIAERVISQYPQTQAARDLRGKIGRLRELAHQTH